MNALLRTVGRNILVNQNFILLVQILQTMQKVKIKHEKCYHGTKFKIPDLLLQYDGNANV